MKFIILVIAFMLVALISYPQAAARRGFGQRPWTVNKEEFSSGDTLVFTLKITSREKLYYYLSPEYYTLYQIEGDASANFPVH